MSMGGPNTSGFQLDINQILLEAQHRWLRPAEICEILQSYQKFHITPEPPYKPVSGSVFLFDRKVLRYFRKDGHNWRKKRDGKTVKEAHEKLKVGSIDVLHCYYAHGEENEYFQRRSYWMLEQDLTHIVFVHYLEVKGNKTSINYINNSASPASNSQNANPLPFSFPENINKLASAHTDSTSPTSTLTVSHDEAESEDSLQVSSRFHSSIVESRLTENVENCISSSSNLLPCSVDGTWTKPTVDCTQFPCGGRKSICCNSSGSHITLDQAFPGDLSGYGTTGEIAYLEESRSHPPDHRNWQEEPLTIGLISDPVYGLESAFSNQRSFSTDLENDMDSFDTYLVEQGKQPHSAELGPTENPILKSCMSAVGTGSYSFMLKQSFLGGGHVEEGLKKVDSFSRWMSNELGEVEELQVQSTTGIPWNVMESKDMVDDNCYIPPQLHLDVDLLNPSLSNDQLFSIIDFSPNWAYVNADTKVVITGKLLKSKEELAECKWSCMFGEVEVPAETLADGILLCHAPHHKAGLVPFYVTCSNRLACSEVREFEYRVGHIQVTESTGTLGGTSEMHIQERFRMLLSLHLDGSPSRCNVNYEEKQYVSNKIISLIDEHKSQIGNIVSENNTSEPRMEEQVPERLIEDEFYSWLLLQVNEEGEVSSVLDKEGQGLVHLAAALGYNWVFKPMLASGGCIDFRDVNGWTALHWAAFHGREKTVVALVSLGSAPGALTDPCAEFPLGRTPADLASGRGHKGISGFLAESNLTKHLSSLTLSNPAEDITSEISGANDVLTVSERSAVPESGDDVPDALSLKDSLAAVRNATQAAARIHQIFRIQSFQRKQLNMLDSNETLSPDEQAFSLVASKTSRLGRNDGIAHASATCIQKKFRGWKKRKEFLLIRQRIVKIQAHVRGHQVRKKYKTIVWSVGILEKVILRWRRKGSGLRGFRTEKSINGAGIHAIPAVDDDLDFLKEGRKQAEQRMHKALDRVKSMALYPEARAQYRRLLTVADGLRDSKDATNMCVETYNNIEYPVDDLIDVEALLDDNTFMSIAFE